jgi:ferredoxin
MVARRRGSSDAAQKLPKNVPGKYYTTDECDGCAYCAAVAPDNFEFEKSTNTYFIGRQPNVAGEEEVVREAMEDCPVDAIHSDDEEEKAEEEPDAELLERLIP